MVETTSQLSTSTWSDDSDSPEAIRARIQATRAHMSEVVDAIQLKLSPERLTQEAKEMMKDATVRKVEKMANMTMNKADSWRTQMMETIRQNPIPAALVGIGLGWLLIEGRRSPSYNQSNYSGRYYDASREMRYYPEQKPLMAKAQDTIAENMSQVQDKASEMTHTVQDKLGRVTDNVQTKAGEVTQNVQDKLGQVADTVQTKAGEVANRASETASNLQARASEMTSNLQSTVTDQADYLRQQAQYQSERAKQTFQNTLEQNPLAVGAVAIVAGAAIGLMLPITQKEDELMGEARDRLMQQAQDKAKETLKMVEDRAGEAYRTATEGTALQSDEPQHQEAPFSTTF